MPASQPHDVTRLLMAWGSGDESALAELMPIVHAELKRLARQRLREEAPGHLLQTTAVVNEAYLRLVDARKIQWHDRAHFFGIASRIIRQILVDAARVRSRQKRGGGARRVELDENLAAGRPPDDDLLALDEALEALAEFDELGLDRTPVQLKLDNLSFAGTGDGS